MGCPKMVPKGDLSEMISNWQISIGYEDNQIMTQGWQTEAREKITGEEQSKESQNKSTRSESEQHRD